MLKVPDEGKEVNMRSLEKVVSWLEGREASYYFDENGGIKAKVLLRDGERLVRVVRGWKGNMVGRVKGTSKIVVFPEIFNDLQEGQVLACKLIEKESYYIGIPLSIQNSPPDVNIFWIERP
jgi:hypothetical protein